MFNRFRQHAHQFMAARCGTRFRAHHRRQQARPAIMRTVIAVGFGLLLFAAGLAMLVLPGPGVLVATIGAAMIAGESLLVARWLDRADFCLNRAWGRWRNGNVQ